MSGIIALVDNLVACKCQCWLLILLLSQFGPAFIDKGVEKVDAELSINPRRTLRGQKKLLVYISIIILVVVVIGYNLTKKNVTTVEVIEVSQKKMVENVPADGKVISLDKEVILSEAGGTVKNIYVHLGEQVKAGQVLAELYIPKAQENMAQARADLFEAQSALSQALSGGKTADIVEAEAALHEAESTYKIDKETYIRTQALYEQGALARSELDQAQSVFYISTSKLEKAADVYRRANDSAPQSIQSLGATVESARIHYESAERQASGQGLVCPRDSRILSINVNPGDVISESTSIMTISNLTQLEIHGHVPEMVASKIKIGQKVKISGNGFPNVKYSGKVVQVGLALVSDSQSQENKESLPIVVEAESMDGLLPGFNVNLDITTMETNALGIPVEALVEQDNENSVWRVKDGIAHLVPIKTGFSDGLMIQIKSGLKLGDRVIVSPPPGLAEGNMVRAK